MFKKIAFDRLSQGLDQYLSLIKAKLMKKILQLFVLSLSMNSFFFNSSTISERASLVDHSVRPSSQIFGEDAPA